MKIMPIISNPVRFGMECGEDDYSCEYKNHRSYKPKKSLEQDEFQRGENPFEQYENTKGCVSFIACGALLTAILGIAGLSGLNSSKENQQDLITNPLESYDLRKDTLVIKDITGDEKPDIILFKEDGSKVIVDVENGKVLQDTTITQ